MKKRTYELIAKDFQKLKEFWTLLKNETSVLMNAVNKQTMKKHVDNGERDVFEKLCVGLELLCDSLSEKNYDNLLPVLHKNVKQVRQFFSQFYNISPIHKFLDSTSSERDGMDEFKKHVIQTSDGQTCCDFMTAPQDFIRNAGFESQLWKNLRKAVQGKIYDASHKFWNNNESLHCSLKSC